LKEERLLWRQTKTLSRNNVIIFQKPVVELLPSTVFESWFKEKLLNLLNETTAIVMDNASYHSRLKRKIHNSS